MPAPAPDLTGCAPVFLVKNIVKAAEYYRDVLGFDFKRYWGDPPNFCMPARDGLSVFLQEVDDPARVRPNGGLHEVMWDAYFWVKDADGLFEEFRRNGAWVAYEPLIKQLYQMREFAVRDYDGYVLAFGQNWPG